MITRTWALLPSSAATVFGTDVIKLGRTGDAARWWTWRRRRSGWFPRSGCWSRSGPESPRWHRHPETRCVKLSLRQRSAADGDVAGPTIAASAAWTVPASAVKGIAAVVPDRQRSRGGQREGPPGRAAQDRQRLDGRADRVGIEVRDRRQFACVYPSIETECVIAGNGLFERDRPGLGAGIKARDRDVQVGGRRGRDVENDVDGAGVGIGVGGQ